MRPPDNDTIGTASRNDWAAVASQLKSGGWIAALLGMAGMVARLLLRPEEGMTWIKAAQFVTVAAIGAIFADLALAEIKMAPTLKAATLGISGYSAPELFDIALRWINKTAEQKLGMAKKKQNAKPKRKKR